MKFAIMKLNSWSEKLVLFCSHRKPSAGREYKCIQPESPFSEQSCLEEAFSFLRARRDVKLLKVLQDVGEGEIKLGCFVTQLVQLTDL